MAWIDLEWLETLVWPDTAQQPRASSCYAALAIASPGPIRMGPHCNGFD
ncbi:hypothetical protein [Achromobacter xylosoxidans]|nr:hypothetical protein [Achromobacter xylosoxidans]